jgi:hypothetical protein
MRAGRCGLLALGIVLFTTGCSTTAQGSQLGMAKASAVAGLPVPSNAVLVSKRNQLAEYRIPRDVTLATLNNWFEQYLSRNQSWKQWSSCQIINYQRTSPQSMVWSWKQAGSFLYLATISTSGQIRFTESVQKLSIRQLSFICS